MKESRPFLLLPITLLALTGCFNAGSQVHTETLTIPATPAGEVSSAHAPDPSTQVVRQAVSRALPYIEEHGVAWMQEHKCVSCHQVPSMLWSYNEAASHGVPVDRAKLEEWNRWAIEKSLEAGVNNSDGIGQMILGRPRTAETEGLYEDLARLVAKAQEGDGSWKAGGQLPQQRRPKDETHRVSTMWSILALDSVRGDGEALARGREHVEPRLVENGRSHEWTIVRLLYHHRSGEEAKKKQLLGEVLAEQNDDGGWAWIRGEASDAFATGQTLYALEAVGWPMDDATVARARRFLLETQRDDGSWTVRSTLEREEGPIPTSDYWGTGWAVIGLLRCLPAQTEAETARAFAG